ncbi:MAG: LamG-like jellyroll fold domain-containing protein [Candidatus Firestonebacteria bacterium]
MPVNNNDEISVSAWFYKNSNDTVNNDTIFEGWSWNANSQLEEGFGLRFGSWTPNTIGFIVVTKDASGTRTKREAQKNMTNSVGAWYHVAGVYNKTTGEQKLYIDGQLVNTQTHTAGNTVVPLTAYPDMRIGHSRAATGYFNGKIDEVRLYNRALTDADVQELYAYTVNGSVPAANTGSATNITSTSATLNGIINPKELSTTAYFEYGLSSGIYGNQTPIQNFTGSNDQNITADISNLTANTTYYYRVKAINNLGTTNGQEQTFTTSQPPQGAMAFKISKAMLIRIKAMVGGRASSSIDPNTAVNIYANTIAEDVQILIKNNMQMDDDEQSKITEASGKSNLTILRNASRVFKILKASDETEYVNASNKVMGIVEIPYEDTNNDGIVDGTSYKVEGLKIVRINEGTTKWEVVSDGVKLVDKSNKVVKAEINHFSIYSIGATVIPNDLSSIVLYPNPFKPSRAKDGVMKIINLTDSTKVEIWTITGDLVKNFDRSELIALPYGLYYGLVWDGKNNNGEEVASGIYIYYISDEKGNKTKGKISVIK